MVTKFIALVAALGGVGYWMSTAPTSKTQIQDRPSREIKLAPTKYQSARDVQRQRAILAGGCFWGLEYHFRQVPGITATAVGFIGGKVPYPTYRQVCYENTGHAEAVLLEFDPTVISYGEILSQFWQLHNPCTLNRQGPDVGNQYRSAIFYLNDKQKQIAQESMSNAAELFKRPIVTQLVEAPQFYMAEDYHQQYAEKTGKAYCPIDRSDHIGGE